MAKKPGNWLSSWLIAALIAIGLFLSGLAVELAGNQLTDLLEGRWYAPWVVWGGLGVAAAVAVASGLWAVKQQRAKVGSSPSHITVRDISHSNVLAGTTAGVALAGDQPQISGDVVGRDKIVYQGVAPTALSALHQIPPPPGDFTGRTGELAELREKIRQAGQGGAAISGLQGMGGIGKTALARKLAQELTPAYPDAQIELDLKGLDAQPLSPAQVMAHVIRAYRPEARLPETEAELAGLYRSVLHGQKALLLLDNAANREQVLPLLPPQGCLLLVTSRQRFDLPGLFALDLDTLLPQEAREFLLTIEPRIRQEAEAIAELCGYLPLALRVAASALKVRVDLTPADYLRRLAEARELFPEVDASLSLSYALLTPDLQARWRTLAVFPGPFAHPAAAAVWEMEPEPAHDNLGALLGYSLVEWDPEPERYRLHDLARLYADARLSEEERAAARQRHAAHFRNVLGYADQLYLEGGDNLMQGLALYDLEWGNIQAGQAWAAEHAEGDDEAAALCSTYSDAGAHLLDLRLHPRERISWLEAALAASRRLQNREAEGRHLGNLGLAYVNLGETRRAIEYLEQSLAISRETGDRRGEAITLGNLGLAYDHLGETNRAIGYDEQSLGIAREVGDRQVEGGALGNLGAAYHNLGETRRAIEYREQSLAIDRETGDHRSEGINLGSLGAAYLNLGETRCAVGFYEQALAIAREIGDRRSEGQDLGSLGNAYAILGEFRRAIDYQEQSLAIAREVGDRRSEGSVMINVGTVYRGLGESNRAIESYERALVIFREIGERRGEGTTLGNLGATYMDLGENRNAIEFYEQALVIGRETGDRRVEGSALFNMSIALDELGDRPQAIAHAEAALQIYQEIEDPNAAMVREQLARWRGNSPPSLR